MSVITYREALRQAIDEEMATDSSVFLLGEEVGTNGGAFGVTTGLQEKYGKQRLIDTPIAELGFTALGVGAALAGLRPIVDWMNVEFGLLAIDQVVNAAALMRTMSGGQYSVPLVIRGPNGGATNLSSQHSTNYASFYVNTPGLKVLAPFSPQDAKGLLKSAIRDNNPVIFLENEVLYGSKGEVPEGEFVTEIGQARILETGNDISIISYGYGLTHALKAAKRLQKEQGISCEIIDLRSLKPLDTQTLETSVIKTSRALVIDEAFPYASVGSWIQGLLASSCFDYLDAPVECLGNEDIPMPYNTGLEQKVRVNEEKVVQAVLKNLQSISWEFIWKSRKI